eukprot:1006714-Amorphochlora_amoeboformis.AAC.2
MTSPRRKYSILDRNVFAGYISWEFSGAIRDLFGRVEVAGSSWGILEACDPAGWPYSDCS